MSSDAKRILAQHDHRYDSPNSYPGYYTADNVWDRVASPAILVPILVLIATVVYQTASQSGQLPPLPQLLWDGLVHIVPGRLLFAVDDWLSPPLFPLPMLQAQTRTHAAKSDVLRKLLGVDKPGGIMMSVSQAGRRSLGGLSGGTLGYKGPTDRPAGLGNYDNSCYQNSILQGLSSLKSLPTYLSGLALGAGPDQSVERTTDTLRELITDLNNESNNGQTLWTPAVLKNMSTWQQQDAQEYYSKLLDEIDKEIAKAARSMYKPPGFESDCAKDDSTASQHSDDSGYQSVSTHSKAGSEAKVIRNPLEGLTAQRVACVACGYSEGLSMIPFNCLTLNLGDQGQHDLFERLDSYTKVEPIQGVECAKCTLKKFQYLINKIIDRVRQSGAKDEDFPEPFARLQAIEAALEEDDFSDETLTKKCKIPPQQRVSSTKTKQTVIARPPQSLAIHINRSVFDETTGNMYKNLAAVRFPMTLDLGAWCLGSADGFTGHVGEDADPPIDEKAALAAKDEEQWLLDPTLSMVAGDLHPSKITGPVYELRAVVTHQGRHENGHYVCYRRHPRMVPQERDAETSEKPAKLASEDHHHDDEVSSEDDKSPVEGETQRSEGTPKRSLPGEPPSQWWRLSDHNVAEADEEFVLGQGGVFMLFYDCIDPNSVLNPDVDAFADTLTDIDPSAEGQRERAEEAGAQQPVVLPIDKAASLLTGDAGVEEASTWTQTDVLELASAVPLPDDEDEDLA